MWKLCINAGCRRRNRNWKSDRMILRKSSVRPKEAQNDINSTIPKVGVKKVCLMFLLGAHADVGGRAVGDVAAVAELDHPRHLHVGHDRRLHLHRLRRTARAHGHHARRAGEQHPSPKSWSADVHYPQTGQNTVS